MAYNVGSKKSFDDGALALKGATSGEMVLKAPAVAGSKIYTFPTDETIFNNTTASFTTALETKVNGIEAGADVTDATNVASAGATMDADTSLVGNGWFIDEDNMASDDATKAPSQQSVKAYVDGLVVGLLDDRGSYDASVNTFPASGGSGTAGAVLKGDLWYISVAGTLGGVAYAIGDSVRALVDAPAQTASNWSGLESNIGFVPANVANPLSQFASTTSAQLAGVISDETGSGALVFGTSPVIVTPDLGTPTALVGTNITGTGASFTSGKATNIAGGLGGSIPYQTAVDATALLANGTAGQVLTSAGTTLAPTWETPSTGGKRFSATIGDGASTAIAVAHGLSIGAGDGIVQVKLIATDTFVDVETKLDGTNVTITFSFAPASNTYRVTVIA